MDFMNVPKAKAQLYKQGKVLTGDQPDAATVEAPAEETQYLRRHLRTDAAGAPEIQIHDISGLMRSWGMDGKDK